MVQNEIVIYSNDFVGHAEGRSESVKKKSLSKEVKQITQTKWQAVV
jgi:hypothetical protein